MRKTLISLLTFALIASPLMGLGNTAKAATTNTAVRGESALTVYWYAPDGKRYTFPNAGTYFTWFPSFDSVISLSDAELQAIPLGNQNATYRPGAKLVKIQTDPKVYAVSKNAVLRHVTSESLARDLYGADWRLQVQDIPDTFFTNYTVGTPIYSASDYNVSNEYNGVTYPHESLKNSTNGNTYQTGTLTLNADRTSIRSGEALTLTANYNATFPTNGRIEIKNVTSNGTVKTCYSSYCSVTIYPMQVTGMNSVQYIATVKNSTGSAIATQYSPVIYFNGNSNTDGTLTLTADRTTVNVGEQFIITATYSGNLPPGGTIEFSGPSIGRYQGNFWSYCINQNPCQQSFTINSYNYDLNAGNATQGIYRFHVEVKNGSTILAQNDAPTITVTTSQNGQVTLNANPSTVIGGQTYTLTAHYPYALSANERLGIGQIASMSDPHGNYTLQTCNSNTCTVSLTAQTSGNADITFYAGIYDSNTGSAVSNQLAYTSVHVNNSTNGLPKNDGENYINGLTLQADQTSIDSGDRVKLTANAFNAGNWSYTGNRIEIRDLRNGSIVKTCYDQSWCVADLTVSRLQSENQAQFEARIYDRNGNFVMSQNGPVIYFTGNGTGSTSDASALTGYANIEFNPNSNLRTNGTIYISANVLDTNARTADLVTRVYDERSSSPIATCYGAITCTASYFTGASPVNTRIYAIVTSASNPGSIETSHYQLTTTY